MHEPDGNRVIYEDGQEEEIAEKLIDCQAKGIPPRNTALNRYFELNRMALMQQQVNPQLANKLLQHTYATVLHDFSYEGNFWRERTISRKLGQNTIIRLGPAPPRNKELHVILIT